MVRQYCLWVVCLFLFALEKGTCLLALAHLQYEAMSSEKVLGKSPGSHGSWAHIPVNTSSGEGRCEDDLREDLGLGADIPGREGMLPPTRDLPALQP